MDGKLCPICTNHILFFSFVLQNIPLHHHTDEYPFLTKQDETLPLLNQIRDNKSFNWWNHSWNSFFFFDSEQLPCLIPLYFLNVMEFCSFQIRFGFVKRKKSQGASSMEYGFCQTWGISYFGKTCCKNWSNFCVVLRRQLSTHFQSKHSYKQKNWPRTL